MGMVSNDEVQSNVKWCMQICGYAMGIELDEGEKVCRELAVINNTDVVFVCA